MEIILLPKAKQDMRYWQQCGRKDMVKRISSLLQDIVQHPTTGIGKPEALKHNLSGWWSRRITAEHRLVYTIKNNAIVVAQCRFHYE